jgi:hypothetical protein
MFSVTEVPEPAPVAAAGKPADAACSVVAPGGLLPGVAVSGDAGEAVSNCWSRRTWVAICWSCEATSHAPPRMAASRASSVDSSSAIAACNSAGPPPVEASCVFRFWTEARSPPWDPGPDRLPHRIARSPGSTLLPGWRPIRARPSRTSSTEPSPTSAVLPSGRRNPILAPGGRSGNPAASSTTPSGNTASTLAGCPSAGPAEPSTSRTSGTATADAARSAVVLGVIGRALPPSPAPDYCGTTRTVPASTSPAVVRI